MRNSSADCLITVPPSRTFPTNSSRSWGSRSVSDSTQYSLRTSPSQSKPTTSPATSHSKYQTFPSFTSTSPLPTTCSRTNWNSNWYFTAEPSCSNTPSIRNTCLNRSIKRRFDRKHSITTWTRTWFSRSSRGMTTSCTCSWSTVCWRSSTGSGTQ